MTTPEIEQRLRECVTMLTHATERSIRLDMENARLRAAVQLALGHTWCMAPECQHAFDRTKDCTCWRGRVAAALAPVEDNNEQV